MIHIVTAANRAAYAEALEEMYAARWAALVKERGWTALDRGAAAPGQERDAYDDEHACYLIVFAADRSIAMSGRARRADRGGVLLDVFPGLVAPENRFAPGPETWEISRFVIARPFRGDAFRAWRRLLHAGAVEMALARGVTRFIGVTDAFMIANLEALYREAFCLLGPPIAQPDGGTLCGVSMRIDADLLSAMRARMGADGRAPASLDLPAADAHVRLDPHALAAAWRAATGGSPPPAAAAPPAQK